LYQGYDPGSKSKILAAGLEIGNKTATEMILYCIAFGLRTRRLRIRIAPGTHFWQVRRAARTPTPQRLVPTNFCETELFYSSSSTRFKRKFGSSCYKICADYSGYEDCHKRDLVATVLELLSRGFEGVAC
jgi:hypothetical protein